MSVAVGAVATIATAIVAVTATADDRLDPTVGRRVAQNDQSAQVQARVDQMSSQRDDVIATVKRERSRLERLEAYNRVTRSLIDDQEAAKASLVGQIDGIVVVQRGVLPLMIQMIEALELVVEKDVPFLRNERVRRIADLKDMMERSDVTVAEKYRRVMEAYGIEDDYGRKISAYDAIVGDTDPEYKDLTVTFLQFGRLLLIYRTADESRMARWDQNERKWIELDSSYRDAVNRGIRIARKQASPELLSLPVHGAVTADATRGKEMGQ